MCTIVCTHTHPGVWIQIDEFNFHWLNAMLKIRARETESNVECWLNHIAMFPASINAAAQS